MSTKLIFIDKYFQKIGKWYTKAAVIDSNSQEDKCLCALIELIFFYNSDGIEKQLKNGNKVKQLQTQYASLLHKYLKSVHTQNDANALFSDAVMLIHDTERVYNLSLNKLKFD